ncbi:hypothetical protein GDO81_014140 [Engystomops pustulosus]|uniref:IGFBP N-terminal domain-containing protein n=1 Tax=Engystomops pustulosus TaxID=76066 RepID=A0AAV7B890_ENGPU|nr:hypothetical protein GDO81_014140 [Engystomops pustulosus]
MKMTLVFLLFFIFPYFFQPVESAYNCTVCDKSKCPPMITPCPGREAIDPCGCCHHCAKQNGEVCGGPDWKFGYCDSYYKCAAINATGLVEIPDIGVCKDMPGYSPPSYYAEDDDENCPEHSGCYRVMGTCDCVTKRTCIPNFQLSHFQRLLCDPMYDDPYFEDLFAKFYDRPCTRSGCDIVDNECVCKTSGCDNTFQYPDRRSCHNVIMKQLCANVTCPEVEPLKCPRDSLATKPHTPYRQCCPTIPSQCSCDFKLCNYKCPKGKRKVDVWKSDGVAGRCCDTFLCLL